MEQKKEQTKMFTDDEIDLIKSTFKDNLALIKAVRKFMLDLDRTEQEDIMLRKTFKEDVMKVMYKEFLPTLDGNAPLNQVIDLYMTVNIENKNPIEAVLLFKARETVINYLSQTLNKLAELSRANIENEITLKSLISLEEDVEISFVKMVARNTIIGHVENRLTDLNTLANQVELTDEEKEKLEEKNSNK